MRQGNTFSKVSRSRFQTVIDGKAVDLFYLQNGNGMEITVTNFGARVVEFWTPDRNGQFADIVLGHDSLEEYLHFVGERYLGATIGRFGNRIARGKFRLDGIDYQLPLNDGPNSLHGGDKGFDMVVWDALQPNPQTLVFSYLSADGEQGYPGTLRVEMTYHLSNGNEFVITHRAVTDKTTVVNLTHHSFFNLAGEGTAPVNDHILQINADKYLPADETLIPTGEEATVEGSPMDFRTPTAIGKRQDADYRQLVLAKGYDHNWIINRKTGCEAEWAASVYEPVSGRTLEVWTTEPGIQFYGGNFFDGKTIGKGGKPYHFRTSFALETQHYPDSPNQPQFPSVLLRPGETYRHVCTYKLGVR
jgi:aldose 1-epimerase